MRLHGTRLAAIAYGRGLGNALWDVAGAAPSLDQRFAENRSLVDAVSGQNLITFTRASSGTYVGSDGLIKTAGTDVPRFDHDPTTGECLGLLVEEQRTNGIRNNTMVGASAPSTFPTNWSALSSVAGISFEVVGVGTESGISYIDIRAYGTPAGNGSIQITFEQTTTNAAASGETWTISSYCRLMGGTLPSAVYLLTRIGGIGGSFLTFSQTAIVPASSPLISQRFTHIAELSNAATEYITARIDAAVFSGVPVDFTLRIGMPQLEKGAFATSVIPTTTSAVTRSADVASITGANFSSWINFNDGTFFSDSTVIAPNVQTQAVWFLTGGTYLTSLRQPQGAGNLFRAQIGNVFTSIPGTGNLLSDGTTKACIAYSGTAGRLQVGSSSNDVTSAGVLDATDLYIGSLAGGTPLNGTIRRLVYWDQRLPNDTLESITQ